MSLFPLSLLPSVATIFGALLAALSIVTGIVLSKSDRRAKHQASTLRLKRRLAAITEHSSGSEGLFKFFVALSDDVDACRRSHVIIPALTFFYVAVDALAFLLDPDDPPSLDERAYMNWIDRFLNPKGGEYVYPGHKLYIARCRLLGGPIGGQVCAAVNDGPQIAYKSHGSHVVGEGPKAEVQVLSVPILLRDFETAIKNVTEELQEDDKLLAHAMARSLLPGGLGSIFYRSV